jgi:hypothetical protein
MLSWSRCGRLVRATLSPQIEPRRIFGESEDFEKPCQRDEQSTPDPNHRDPGDLAVTGGDLVCEVASNTEQPGCFRDGQSGADRDDSILLFVVAPFSARSETPCQVLRRVQLHVGEREVTDLIGNSRGGFPIVGRDELMERGLELLIELFHGIASIGGLFGWFHPSIVRPDPVSRVSATLSAECHFVAISMFSSLGCSRRGGMVEFADVVSDLQLEGF